MDSLVDGLPPEVLLNIFEYLTYGDLKLIPLVCKRFHSILRKTRPESASNIDKLLFRDAPQGYITPGKVACVLNPSFESLEYNYLPDVEDVLIIDPWRNCYKRLIDINLVDENACSPAVARARIGSYTRSVIEAPVEVVGTGAGGAVTMGDVMKAVADAVKNTWNMDALWGYSWDGFEMAEIVDGVLHLVDGCGDEEIWPRLWRVTRTRRRW